jgi:hypothetical protein
MNIKRQLVILIVICVAALGIFLTFKTHPNDQSPKPETARNSQLVSNPLPVPELKTNLGERVSAANTDFVPTVEKTNASTFVEGYFKTVTDESSGRYAIVGLDKKSVALKDKTGDVIWSVDVVKFLGVSPIDSLKLAGTNLVVKVSRDYVLINKDSGKIEGYAKTGPDAI